MGTMNTAVLLWGMLFGSIGLGFFMYGKKQRAAVPLMVGIALSVYPFFVTNLAALIVVGLALTVLPYFVRI